MSKFNISPLEALQFRVEKTGDLGEEDFLFNHLTLREFERDQILKIGSLKEFAKFLNLDFITVLKEGTIDFTHVTREYNLEDIEIMGLLNSQRISDLGRGIYVIPQENNEIALDNLKTYFAENIEDDEEELVIITSSYSGKYIECEYGEGHEGYLVLLTDEIPADTLVYSNITLADFIGC